MTSPDSRTWAGVVEGLGDMAPKLGGPRFLGLLRIYVGELEAWGTRIHLTGRERMPEVLAEQISDSAVMLLLAEEVLGAGDAGVTVADIGSGAGFPGVIWKLARPHWKIDLFERKEKLATFLERIVALLSLEETRVLVRDIRRGCSGERYDIVTSKASGRFGDMLPLAQALARAGGCYITIKGAEWEEELEGAAAGHTGAVRRADLPGGRGEALALRL